MPRFHKFQLTVGARALDATTRQTRVVGSFTSAGLVWSDQCKSRLYPFWMGLKDPC